MATTELLARVKDVRDQKGRMYDSELQTLLADVAAHLEGDAAPDLLAGCKDMLDYIRTYCGRAHGIDLAKWSAAIAKATGD